MCCCVVCWVRVRVCCVVVFSAHLVSPSPSLSPPTGYISLSLSLRSSSGSIGYPIIISSSPQLIIGNYGVSFSWSFFGKYVFFFRTLPVTNPTSRPCVLSRLVSGVFPVVHYDPQLVTATIRASSGYSRAHQHVSPPTHARRRTTAPRSGDRILRELRGRR